MSAGSDSFPHGSLDAEALGDKPRIVVVVRDHMSGVLYSVPALRAIRRHWPKAELTLLTSNYSAPILDGGSQYLDRILPLYTFADEPGRFERPRDLFRKFRTWAALVGRVDLVIHLRHVGGGTLRFCQLLGNPQQVGYSQGPGIDHLLTLNVGKPDVTLGSRERNEIIIEAMGINPQGDHIEMTIAEEDQRWAAGWLKQRGHRDGDHLLVVHPGSHWGCNQWLPERWSETINNALGQFGGTAVITGVRRERPLADKIADGVDGKVLVAAGDTDLGQFAAMIGKSDLVLAIDASPTQICQALRVPAVIMMGAGNPAWNGPVGDEPMVMLQEWDNDDPRPELCKWADGACNSSLCTSRLEDISVTQVLDSVEVVLKSSASED